MYLIAGLNPEETNNITKSDHSRRLPRTRLSWTRLATWNHTTCDTLSTSVQAGKRSVFTQNLGSSVTRCGRRGRRSLIRSTVMGLHASVLLVWCHHSLWTTRQSSQCQCSNTFTQLSRAVYTRKLNKVELQWAGFWFLFYSKVMELWATAVGRDNETSGSTRPRKGLNLNRPIKRAPWWRQRQVWLHTLVWLNLFLLTFPHLSPSALDQLTMNSLIPQTTSILKWIFRPVALLFHVTSVKNLLVPQQEHFLSLHILV